MHNTIARGIKKVDIKYFSLRLKNEDMQLKHNAIGKNAKKIFVKEIINPNNEAVIIKSL